MRLLYRYICLLGLVLGLVACSSTRKMQHSPLIGNLTGEAYIEKAITAFPSWDALSGKVFLQLLSGDNKQAKVSASFRLKRDKLIRLSVAPVLGIEMARLDISPDGLLLIDRMNKRYVQLSFDEIRTRWSLDLNFGVLQSLFFNELFFPGKTTLDSSDSRLFGVEQYQGQMVLKAKTSKRFSYRFRTSALDASLLETMIGVAGVPYELNWLYQDFKPLSGRNFPERMEVVLKGVNKPLALSMDFSRLSVGGDWDVTSEVSSRYKKVSVQTLLEILLK